MIIILEPQTSIITSVIMISFPLIMIFGNLPLILKKKKKEFVTLLYVTKEL